MFFALGGALFAAQAWRGGADDEIRIGAEQRAEARAEALAVLGRPPSAEEERALLDARIDEELLYREALARGLDREDAGVRRRLARNLRFLSGAPDVPPADAEEEALAREARALGMDRTDTVVRRKLVQRVTREIEAPARAAEPDEGALRAWLAAHPERALRPRRAAFRQLFFDPARRGAARAEADAAAALGALRAGARAQPPADPCLVPADAPLQSESLIARTLGADFASALFEAPRAAWSGPLRSSLGWHVVRVSEAESAAALPFEALRAEARAAVLDERSAAALRAFLDERRGSTRIRIEPDAAAEPPASTAAR